MVNGKYKMCRVSFLKLSVRLKHLELKLFSFARSWFSYYRAQRLYLASRTNLIKRRFSALTGVSNEGGAYGNPFSVLKYTATRFYESFSCEQCLIHHYCSTSHAEICRVNESSAISLLEIPRSCIRPYRFILNTFKKMVWFYSLRRKNKCVFFRFLS